MRFNHATAKFKDASWIKDRINPLEFYQREDQKIQSKHRGNWVIAGLCPFHADRSAGSFYVHKETGAFRCFSCDAKGGDIIAFIQKKYEMSFLEAIKKLHADWRIS